MWREFGENGSFSLYLANHLETDGLQRKPGRGRSDQVQPPEGQGSTLSSPPPHQPPPPPPSFLTTLAHVHGPGNNKRDPYLTNSVAQRKRGRSQVTWWLPAWTPGHSVDSHSRTHRQWWLLASRKKSHRINITFVPSWSHSPLSFHDHFLYHICSFMITLTFEFSWPFLISHLFLHDHTHLWVFMTISYITFVPSWSHSHLSLHDHSLSHIYSSWAHSHLSPHNHLSAYSWFLIIISSLTSDFTYIWFHLHLIPHIIWLK